MTDIAIGLAGVGYWGSKLARNIDAARGCRLAAICDPDAGRLAEAAQLYPAAAATSEFAELLAASVDAIVLATPASLHAQHVEAALASGRHVLVEKPLALTSSECDDLNAHADDAGLTLMVGHTFLYSEPVRQLRRLIEEGELGRVLYAYAQRLNLGVIRDDLNTLWNFGPHDVSILLYLLDAVPERVTALQYSLLDRSIEDVVFMTLEFPDDGVVAHVHESWLDPRKIRQLTVVGDRKMVVYDDTDVETPIRIYDKGVVRSRAALSAEGFGEFKLQIRAGDMLAPRIVGREPLRVEVQHFVDCIATRTRPMTDGHHGRQVVAVLEAAERSARERLPGVEVATLTRHR